MQDSISGVVGCTSSRVGRDLVWQFLQENWKSLVTRFGDKSNFLIAFVEVKLSLPIFDATQNFFSFSVRPVGVRR